MNNTSKMKQMTRLNAYRERIGNLCDRLEDLAEDLNELFDDVSEETAKQGFVKAQSVDAQKKVTRIAEELREKGVPGFEPKKKKTAEVMYYLIVNDDLALPIEIVTEEDDDEY